MLTRIFLLLCLLLPAAFGLRAQDKLFIKTQRAPIECEITEVGTGEIKYHLIGRPLPIITIDKEDVVKVVFSNGQEQVFIDPLNDFSLYTGQKRWNAKGSLLSPLTGTTQLVLERSLKPGRSEEYELNLIGLGKNPVLQSDYYGPYGGYRRTLSMDPCGVGIGYGMKFVRLPDFMNGRARLRHILQGSYVRPGVSAGYYQRNFLQHDYNLGFSTTRRMPVYSACISMTFGRQWVLDNTISLDVYGSVGLAVDNVRRNQQRAYTETQPNPISNYFYYDDTAPYNAFGYTRFSRGDLGLGLGAGLRVGYMFNVKKKKANAAKAKKGAIGTPRF